MANQPAQTSPQIYARIGGTLYLLIIALGILTELLVRGGLIVSGDAAATAANVMAHPLRWRIGIASDIVMHLLDVGVMVCVYVLLRPVNKNLARLAILFNLVQTAVLVAFKLNLMMALFLTGDTPYLKAFTPDQLNALTYLFIRADTVGFAVGLIFFGFTLMVQGYLIFRSGYLPKLIGVLIEIAGVCYLTNSFVLILFPAIANVISPAILVPCFIGELSFSLWLLVRGVNVPAWEKRALEVG